ncbi:MAG: hypothetical protein KY469_14515 [Actinobacteria bacterium]|nr:hypothetical protein [Actinomycetota bacterium]
MSADVAVPTAEASPLEVLACFLSRSFEDGDRVGLASGLPVVAYAGLLAHRLGRPNMRLLMGLSLQNFWGRELPDRLHDAVDFRGSYGAEIYTRHYQNLEGIHRRANVFVGGALQVDAYGNSNLIGLRGDDGRMRFRGPGALGTTTMCEYVRTWHVYVNRHDPGTFVEACDYVSCVGHASGGPEGRAAVGLRGSGPTYVLSPQGIFDFPAPGRRMRLRHLQPGVAVEQVVAATGFELDVEGAEPLPAPTPRELDTLRRIDSHGTLRGTPTEEASP